ncbi:hypothetical protein H5410_036645 [Solanum commersonii]|uniref:Endonuclease/exonuclease/phosphatase domain-containing protein n=1 Tax=Solanum commersonii TaxID=4109 RepID=A0A9J5Y5F9_SOLCO|nr:hypothetical protein H5410_036645 [Solanum commersonii]
MELHDPHMSGGNFTWFRGVNHPSAARLDRFLFSMEWEESFKNIKQKLMPRAVSDHSPVTLECGDWEHKRSRHRTETPKNQIFSVRVGSVFWEARSGKKRRGLASQKREAKRALF